MSLTKLISYGDSLYRKLWQPQRLPAPVIYIMTRTLFAPTIVYNVIFYTLMSSRQWWNRIDEHLFLGGVPCWFHFEKLHTLGVRSLVNLLDEFPHVLQRGEIRGRNFTELHIPTPDYLEPQLPDIEKAVAFLEMNAANSRITYVHCKAGKGRAPTIVLCYLMKKHRFTPAESLAYIVARRPQVSKHLHLRPSVNAFWAKHVQNARTASAPGLMQSTSSKFN